MRYARLLFVALAIAVTGCAPAGSGGVHGPRRQQNLITQEEIHSTPHRNLYDIVAQLRPVWLRTRGQISLRDPQAGQVVVYLNGVRAGGAEYLRQVSPDEVTFLEYFNETEAASRYGLMQGGGSAIVIHTSGGG